MKVLFAVLVLLAFNANAWMEKWAPEFTASTAKVRKLPAKSLDYFVRRSRGEDAEVYGRYAQGGAIDLNGDGIEDYVIIIPYMGSGLDASLEEVVFIVSDGANWRTETVVDCMGADLSDLVTVGSKIYFRNSAFCSSLEKSKHNHWVYQMFSFDKKGVMKCANADFKGKFPAVTIFYENPKFKSVELTAADRQKIAALVEIKSKKFKP